MKHFMQTVFWVSVAVLFGTPLAGLLAVFAGVCAVVWLFGGFQ